MIDRIKFDDYVSQYGNQFFAEEIIDTFFSIFDERVEIIKKHVADRNFIGLEKAAHSIRSATCSFWDPVSLHDSAILEQKARNCEEAGLDEAFQMFEVSIKLLLSELKEIRKEITSEA